MANTTPGRSARTLSMAALMWLLAGSALAQTPANEAAAAAAAQAATAAAAVPAAGLDVAQHGEMLAPNA